MTTKLLRLLILLVLSPVAFSPAFGQRRSRRSEPYCGEGHHIESRGGTYAASTNSHPSGVISKTRELATGTASTSLITACAGSFTEAADVIIRWFW